MRQDIVISNIFCFFLLLLPVIAHGASTINPIELSQILLTKSEKKQVLAKKIVVRSTVNSSNNKKNQSLDFFIVGKHKRSCRFAIKKLKRYEEFENFIESIEKSEYSSKTKILNILMDPPIIPGKLGINFKIDRVSGVGVYPFIFDKGFLKGLNGEIHISEHKHRCLFYVWAKWEGKSTKFSDSILELFASTISRLVMEKLFRISTTL